MPFLCVLLFLGVLCLNEEEVMAAESRASLHSSGTDPLTCCNGSLFTPLTKAAMYGQLEEAERILLKTKESNKSYETVNERDEEGMTALHWACLRGKMDVIKKLLEFGADIHSVDKGNNTALHLSTMSGNPGAVRHLLLSGSSVNAQNSDGDTALHLAVKEGDFEIVEMLLSSGAMTHGINLKRRTPLGVAFRKGNMAITRLLKVATEPRGGHIWQSVADTMPPNAVVGGNDPGSQCDPAYVGRVLQGGRITPAKICKGEEKSFEAHIGNEVFTEEFEVLCSDNVAWKLMTDKDEIPPEAVEGGTSENGRKLFIGRWFVLHDVQVPEEPVYDYIEVNVKTQFLMLGKVDAISKRLYISFDGNVFEKKKYEILITY